MKRERRRSGMSADADADRRNGEAGFSDDGFPPGQINAGGTGNHEFPGANLREGTSVRPPGPLWHAQGGSD